MEFSVIGKILETLKQIAPATSRGAVIYNPDNLIAVHFQRLLESFAVPLSVQPIIAPIHTIADIERALEALAEPPNGGIFFPPDVTSTRFATGSSPWSHATVCRRSMRTASSWPAAA
jgi:putative ABC transport system substrate-binding protein